MLHGQRSDSRISRSLDIPLLSRKTVPIGSVQFTEKDMTKRDAKRQAILDTAYRMFRTQGFDGTSVSQITAEVGGSKATIYSHFPSKEVLFVDCMTAVVDDFLTEIVAQSAARLDANGTDLGTVLLHYGTSYLKVVCSPDIVAARRLLIAEAARSGIGKLFSAKIAAMRAHVVTFLSQLMAAGSLRPDDAGLAAEHLRALLEAEIIEPLLLQARQDSPDETEIGIAADRAVTAFLRAYAPAGQ
jgi:AcrR family transcriptional regulator